MIGLAALTGCASHRAAEAQARAAATSANKTLYKHAAVAADHPVASQAGLEMLARGGNAVDAAVATSFCLSVVRPYSCGIGGGGFMVIEIPASDGAREKRIAINYRETCPAGVGSDYYSKLPDKTASRFGCSAVGVPGTVAGLAYALEHYGTLDLATVLGPAIRAAEEGVPADANFIAAAKELEQTIRGNSQLKDTALAIRRDLTHSGHLKIGDIITQPDQARALRLIAQQGTDAFYRGPIAQAIVQCMRANHGSISAEDLKNYSVAKMEPLVGSFHGCEFVTMPAPSSGGTTMLEALGILQPYERDLVRSGHNSSMYIHLITESLKHAFADRARWLGDPAFVDIPDWLLSQKYLVEIARTKISKEHTQPIERYGTAVPPPADSGTSHISVIDANGMAVACTETINLNYGSLVTVPGFGFVLNDEMDDFTTISGQPNAFGLTQSDRNLPQAGKRPLSSMAPTIVLKNGKVVMVAGASGGPRIITGTMQCILNCLLFDLTPAEAVSAPRFHHQWMPDVLQLEAGWTDAELRGQLARKGHELGEIATVGQVQLIRVMPDGIRAASDPRKGGAPAGY